MFSDKNKLRILDVGSGSGGNLMGFLDCLREIGLTNKQIDIISVDGFKLALEYQEKKIIYCFLREINSKTKLTFKQEHHRFQSKEHFKTILQNILKENNIKYDIIMTSKFISSLYALDMKGWDGTYDLFTQSIQTYLDENGLALFIETTNPPLDKNINIRRDFMASIMNSELAKLLTPEYSLKHILPLSCAFYYKNCKSTCYTQKIYQLAHRRRYLINTCITFKVLAHRECANKILTEIKKEDRYIKCWKKRDNSIIYPDSLCQKGCSQDMNGHVTNILDAFSFN